MCLQIEKCIRLIDDYAVYARRKLSGRARRQTLRELEAMNKRLAVRRFMMGAFEDHDSAGGPEVWSAAIKPHRCCERAQPSRIRRWLQPDLRVPPSAGCRSQRMRHRVTKWLLANPSSVGAAFASMPSQAVDFGGSNGIYTC